MVEKVQGMVVVMVHGAQIQEDVPILEAVMLEDIVIMSIAQENNWPHQEQEEPVEEKGLMLAHKVDTV